MRSIVLTTCIALLVSCASTKQIERQVMPADIDRHMKNATQLTFDGDNGEAYFSWDAKKLIFQSSRNGYACDKIWTMNINGSDGIQRWPLVLTR